VTSDLVAVNVPFVALKGNRFIKKFHKIRQPAVKIYMRLVNRVFAAQHAI
jgi:hypothetical protein